jgi:hypothetical protein
MNVVTVLIGAAALLYGLYTLWLHKTRPEQLGKSAAMKDAYGPKAGGAVHGIAYSIIPILFGLFVIYLGVRGVAFF